MPELSIEQAFGLAVQHHRAGRLGPAEQCYRQILARQPNHPDALHLLGVIAYQSGRHDAAMDLIRQAIAIKPDFAEAYSNLGMVLRAARQADAAIAAYRQAIALNPSHAEAHLNLGNVLRDQGHLEEATECFRQAIALKGDFAEAYVNLGMVLRRRGQLDEAIATYRQAIALKPDYAEAHHNLALTLLATGDLTRGFEEYEWRWKDFPSSRRTFAQAQWDGSPLNGRTILLHAEQGFGDTIQFIRYLPAVLERGGQAVIESQPELRRLLQPMAGTCPVVPHGSALPRFDVHCPFLSLPRVLGTTLATIPGNVPYLAADATEVMRWRSRLEKESSAINVGVAWAGRRTHTNDRNRSIAPASLAQLAQVPGVRLYSLQKDRTEPSLLTSMNLVDWTAELKDFSDTAALLANLDLVIAVDTAVVHLAGAMARPVWTLLSFAADWRWLLHRADSPWYPTMRLFRQPSFGDWDSVLRQVSVSLAAFATRPSEQR